ncbi:hypothetical protein [Sulfitobacter aestuariivivens]|uniref:Uncharacterized protein n=1 Tax=Sulfitobacter aestuariivivens TaxID=2766981 RepID=A0A927D4F0_9RHOB|nr:hypothetical protein [Sulfitobacter aestuariivivens]MBD3662641.1 hypothetical protein [Sulfitobacter aestuariivivens]
MEATSEKEVHKAIATRLARFDIRDDVLEKVSARVARNGLKVGGVDFCPYGICIDYFCEKELSIDELLVKEKYRVVKLFPYGILVDDLFRVQVEMHVPELAQHGLRG